MVLKLMLCLLQKELFSFAFPFFLYHFCMQTLHGKKWLDHKKNKTHRKNPMIFPTFHSKGEGVKARIINKLPEHQRNTCLTPIIMLWLSFSEVNICRLVWTDYFFGLQGAERESCNVRASETVKQTNFQDPHIVGVYQAADCMMQWFIILGRIDYNNI